jgi:hypothetical protein
MVTGCKLIPNVGSIITFAIQIDCDRETDLSGRYHVSKYPTIKYIQVRKIVSYDRCLEYSHYVSRVVWLCNFVWLVQKDFAYYHFTMDV